MGIAIPVAGLAWVAVGGLQIGSWRRLWAAFAIGMTGSTVLAALLEYSIVAIAALVAGVVAASNPEWLAIFQQVKNQVTNSGDVQTLLTTLAPYLTNPLVLLIALAFASVLAPIIEETLKPAAVWLLGKRLRSPAEGFALGALCGAGFALLEGSLAASGMAQLLGIGLAAARRQFADAYYGKCTDGLGDCVCSTGETLRTPGMDIPGFRQYPRVMEWIGHPGRFWVLTNNAAERQS